MIHWLYIYLLTSNSSSPEGKNHPKLSTDPKVVLWLQILKFIILGSTYWGLHAHLFLKCFYLLSSLLRKMWIYPYDITKELCHKWCKLENFRRVFLCPHLLSKNWSKLCLESTWKESASCGSVLTTSPLIQHWYFTHLPKSLPPISCWCAEKEGMVVRFFSLRKAATIAFDPEAILPQKILSRVLLTLLPVPLLLGSLLWWGLLYFSKPTDPTFAVFLP